MADGEDELTQKVLAAFERSVRQASPFAEDRRLAEELTLEARPAVEALVFAAAHADNRAAIEQHEAQAMVTLLGRRAGSLGATPTAVTALVPSLAIGFREAGAPLPDTVLAPLPALCLEGYVAGREDAIKSAQLEAAVEAAPIVTIVPRALLLVLSGDHEPEVLNEVVERLGRALFDAGATVCIVEARGLQNPTPERALELFGANATARMLGARCIFAGVHPAWLDAAKAARVDLDVITLDPTFEAALRRTLELLDLELKRTSWLPAPLERLLKPSR